VDIQGALEVSTEGLMAITIGRFDTRRYASAGALTPDYRSQIFLGAGNHPLSDATAVAKADGCLIYRDSNGHLRRGQ